jgi:phospholipid/cholesterol/gamma-HCH transport system substrate-binding protein
VDPRRRKPRIHPLWWTAALIIIIVGLITLSMARFAGALQPSVPVTVRADRIGLVMDPGAKVKMRGVLVGRVESVEGGSAPVALRLAIDPEQIKYIPANVQAQIKATTAFGTKYVDLTYPNDPSPKRLAAGQVLRSLNVSTEVNTVFETLVEVLHQVDPEKLNAVLTAVAEAVRGQGQRIGEAMTAANHVLTAINERTDTIRGDWRAFKGFNDAYSAAADDILHILDAASITSTTITDRTAALDSLLLNAIGFSRSGIDLIQPNKDNLVRGINVVQPTTELLMKYQPEYTCLLVGSKFLLDHGGYQTRGGNGYSLVIDSSLLWGDDPYRYPDNLPIVAAKGGPGGKPSCGSLPDVSKNYPVRQLVTNTGWGTGVDIRPNPGIGHPFWADYFPVTRAVPEPPSIRGQGPPAIGPVPYPGAPPYGAPLYGPDGTPLYPPPDSPPPPPGPAAAVPADPAANAPAPDQPPPN